MQLHQKFRYQMDLWENFLYSNKDFNAIIILASDILIARTSITCIVKIASLNCLSILRQFEMKTRIVFLLSTMRRNHKINTSLYVLVHGHIHFSLRHGKVELESE